MPNETRDKIIRTVQQLYSTQSYEEISTTQILKECGISRGALYWHFKDKEDMFNAAFFDCYERVVEVTRQHYSPDKSVIENLKNRLKCLIVFNRENPECLPIITKHTPLMTKTGNPFPYGDFKNDIQELVRAGLENGELVNFPQALLIQLIHVFNREICNYCSENPACYDHPEWIDEFTNRLFSSISA